MNQTKETGCSIRPDSEGMQVMLLEIEGKASAMAGWM